MPYVISQRAKNILDRVSWIVGAVGTFVVANQAALPVFWQGLAPFIGLGLGDIASDIIGWTSGTLTTTTVINQANDIVNGATVSAYLQNEITKLPSKSQTTAATLLALLQAELAANATTTTPVTPVPPAPAP